MKKITLTLLAASVILTSCKMIDIRTEYAKQELTETDTEKGKRLLRETYLKMGYDKLENYQSYSVMSVFSWKPIWAIMPMNPLPRSNNNQLVFDFVLNSFDGKVKYLEGQRKNKSYGIQTFKAYKSEPGTILKEIKGNHETWGLSTYHYVIEAPKRLLNAEFIRYAGETEFEDKKYDLVYVTWGKKEPHKEHDQWMVYINKETGLTDMTKITINDYFLPMPNAMKGGTIRIERKNVDGIYLPSQVFIQLGDPKALKKHVYNFTLSNYQFNKNIDERLYPLKNVEKIGDAKL